MRSVRSVPLFLAAFVALLFVLRAERSGGQGNDGRKWVMTGVARIDITPEEPIRMSGYAARKFPSEGIEMRLWAKALCFGEESEDSIRSILLTVDSIGVPAYVTRQVVERLEAEIGIRQDNVAICASHTHAGPTLDRTLPFMFPSGTSEEERETIRRYTEVLVEKLVEVALEAARNARPAALSWGKGSLDFAVNRRVLEDGKWTGFGIQEDGPVDHSFPFLKVESRKGELLAVLGNYACHCTTLGGDFNRIHGDWAGVAQAEIEKRHPGTAALIAIGCGADQNPSPRGTLELVNAHGKAVADEVDRMLEKDLAPLGSAPRGTFREIRLPLDPLPERETWEAQVAEKSRGYHFAQAVLDKLDAGESLPTEVTYPVQTWTFGEDLAMIFLGGEVVVDYAHRFYREFDAERLWVNAYANDVPCYIPSRRLYAEGGYEVDYSMIYYGYPGRLAENTEDRVADEVLRQLPRAFYSDETAARFPPPVEKEQAVGTLEVADGYRVELVVAEPFVQDPVDLAWDHRGRMWVVEMADYPTGVNGKPGGRVRMLEDVNGDGFPESSTVFLEGLRFPNSVLPWRDGVLVVVADRIFLARDTDGDGKADAEEVIVSGFDSGNSQHQLGGLEWGLDSWIFVANGGSKGILKSKQGGEIEPGGRDLRFRPDTGEIELVSGATQYGRTRDEWGNWFGCNNSKPFWHFALEDRDLRRNPHLSFPDPKNLLGDDPVAGPVFPISRTVTRFNDYDAANRFTSACGLRALAADWSGEAEATHLFVAEPVHNLVSRRVLRPEGASFVAERARGEEEREFLASTDNWFRPASIRTGPDNGLYVVDMYRHVIEHPEWIPEARQRRLDLREGSERGRIYRVFPEGKTRAPMADLRALSTRDLVTALDTGNGTLRDLVHRELLWREDASAVDLLSELALSAERPAVRIQALSVCEELGGMDRHLLTKMLKDDHPGVRRHGVKLANRHLDTGEGLLSEVAALAGDPDAFLRQQVAVALGETSRPEAGKALASILATERDPFVQAAALSSLVPHQASVAVVLASDWSGLDSRLARSLVRSAVASRDEAATARLLSIPREQASLETLSDFVSAFAEAGDSFAEMAERSPSMREALESLDFLFVEAASIAKDRKATIPERTLAISVLGGSGKGVDRDAALLLSLLGAGNPKPLQAAAAERIGILRNDRLLEGAIETHPQMGVSARNSLLRILLARRSWTKLLLDKSADRPEWLRSLDAARRAGLLNHADESIRLLAEKRLKPTDQDASGEFARLEPSITMAGDAEKGRAHFTALCITCHEMEGVGFGVGPDLAALTDKSFASLLRSIVDPNAAVEWKYALSTVEMADGEIASGIISSDTATSVTLVGAGGVETTVLRNRIETLQTSSISPMPKGLAAGLDSAGMADLLAYLQSAGSSILFEPGEDGSIRLPADKAILKGVGATYDPDISAASWISDGDEISWAKVRIPTGDYAVFFHAGLKTGTPASDRSFSLVVGSEEVGGTVEETGSLQRLRKRQYAEVSVSGRTGEIPVRFSHDLRDGEVSLREIVFVPIR